MADNELVRRVCDALSRASKEPAKRKEALAEAERLARTVPHPHVRRGLLDRIAR